jgi:hypothetical protein
MSRECFAIDVGGSIRSQRVIEVLSRVVSLRGAPRYLRSHNGSEFVSRAISCLTTGERELAPASSGDGCLGLQSFPDRTDASTFAARSRSTEQAEAAS